MAEETSTSTKAPCVDKEKIVVKNKGGSGIAGGIYFMAFIGAAVYYIMQATTFWGGVLGFLKAIVWPAMLIFKLFEFLHL